MAEQGIEFESVQVRKQPPSVSELQTALKFLELKKLFSTNGKDYRDLGLKDKLPTMSESDALELLSSNGNLVKRPLLLCEKGALAGFKETEWQQLLG